VVVVSPHVISSVRRLRFELQQLYFYAEIMNDYIVPDDSGIIALVNSKKYQSFVSEYWELEQLLSHFVGAMRKQSLLVWSSGCEGNWKIRVVFEESGSVGYREAVGSIESTNNSLYLTSYDNLTMAAQFEDEVLITSKDADLRIEISDGLYRCKIIQLFNPNDADSEEVFFQESPHFIIEITPSREKLETWTAVPWLVL